MKQFSLDSWIDWQCKLHKSDMDFNLDRITKIADKLDLIKNKNIVFTVAGTNGKGSTVSMLESILYEHGYNIGSYTSPHIIKYNERIKINKKPVSDEEICDAFQKIDNIRGDISLTFFEFGTLASLLIFKRYNLDAIILEVGLGGKKDAVNIIDPTISVITNIGYDHMDILGSDLEQIAEEKSGIMRPSGVTVIGFENPQISIRNKSNELDNKLSVFGENYWIEEENEDYWYFHNKEGRTIKCLYPSLKGDIQLNNAATAIQAIMSCREFIVDEKIVSRAIRKASIIGRFEIIFDKNQVIFDIAHNEQSSRNLLKNIQRYYPNNNFHAVFSVVKDKDIDGILTPLKDIFTSWHIAKINNERGLPLDKIKNNNFFIYEKTFTYDNINEAYTGAKEYISNEDDIIIVFGSCYVVSLIMENLEKNNSIYDE